MSANPFNTARSPGRLGRLLRWMLLLSFLGAGVLAADYGVTTRAMRGSWQFQPPEVSEETVGTMIDSAGERLEGETDEDREHPGQAGKRRRIPPRLRSAMSKVGKTLMGSMASKMKLELSDGAYRIDGNPFSRFAANMGSRTGRGPQLSGCMDGTFLAAFPLMRISCGDGSGRTLWFLMTRWPGDELALFPLPIGNDELKKRMKSMAGERDGAPERRKAASELLTLRFHRRPSP